MEIPKGFEKVACRIDQFTTNKESLYYNRITKEEFILVEKVV